MKQGFGTLLLFTVLIGIPIRGLCQDAKVERSVYGVQTGFLGIWFHNEAALSSEIALRTELGLDSGFFGGSVYDGAGFIMAPVFTLEPRWYYNLEKRAGQGRAVNGNSGNFVSLKSSYNPNWFIIGDGDNVEIVDQISFVPTWGIRRNIGNRFNFEAGIGIGYRYLFYKSAGSGEATGNLHLRVGYRF